MVASKTIYAAFHLLVAGEETMEKSKMAGFVGIIIFLVFTGIAIVQYPQYNFAKQFLSELGIGSSSASWFNAGLTLSGICFAAFFWKMQKESKTIRILGLLGTITLIGIGIFSLRQAVLHFIAATLFFVLTGSTILLFSAKEWKKQKAVAVLGFLAVLSDMALLLLQEPISQKITVGFFLVWIATLSMQK